jgi:hypothetical protein
MVISHEVYPPPSLQKKTGNGELVWVAARRMTRCSDLTVTVVRLASPRRGPFSATNFPGTTSCRSPLSWSLRQQADSASAPRLAPHEVWGILRSAPSRAARPSAASGPGPTRAPACTVAGPAPGILVFDGKKERKTAAFMAGKEVRSIGMPNHCHCWKPSI